MNPEISLLAEVLTDCRSAMDQHTHLLEEIELACVRATPGARLVTSLGIARQQSEALALMFDRMRRTVELSMVQELTRPTRECEPMPCPVCKVEQPTRWKQDKDGKWRCACQVCEP